MNRFASRRVHTFDEPGMFLFGSHIPDHYGAGLKGTTTVVET